MREAMVMRQQRHPNVLPLLAAFLSEAVLWMVMPYVAGGSAIHILNKRCPGVITSCILYNCSFTLNLLIFGSNCIQLASGLPGLLLYQLLRLIPYLVWEIRLQLMHACTVCFATLEAPVDGRSCFCSSLMIALCMQQAAPWAQLPVLSCCCYCRLIFACCFGSSLFNSRRAASTMFTVMSNACHSSHSSACKNLLRLKPSMHNCCGSCSAAM